MFHYLSGTSLPSWVADIFRTNLGAQVRLTFTSQGSSMSSLVPGQGQLLHRAFIEDYKTEFRIWFREVEHLAWKWVSTFPARERPNKIFGVWGQYLTNEYSIAHQDGTSSGFEILVRSGLGIPQTGEVSGLVGYHCQHASALLGFTEYRGGEDSTKYSIFLQVIESFPMGFIP